VGPALQVPAEQPVLHTSLCLSVVVQSEFLYLSQTFVWVPTFLQYCLFSHAGVHPALHALLAHPFLQFSLTLPTVEQSAFFHVSHTLPVQQRGVFIHLSAHLHTPAVHVSAHVDFFLGVIEQSAFLHFCQTSLPFWQ
jgi:hypothetical protein